MNIRPQVKVSLFNFLSIENGTTDMQTSQEHRMDDCSRF